MSDNKKKKSITAKQGYKLLNDRAAKAVKASKRKKEADSPDDSPEDDLETVGVFRKHIERLKQLEKEGKTGEAYDIEVLKSLHELTLELIPIAEENYRKFPIHTAASAVNQYINQSREILNDIRALEDFQARADKLNDIVKNEINEIARSTISNIEIVKNELTGKNGVKYLEKTMKEFMRSQGKSLEELKNRIATRITQMLVSSDDGKKR